MPRTYDRLIRYYDSWFDDLADQDKGFTAEEIVAVMYAIREAQRVGSMSPLDELPQAIKRGLSMATLREQIMRIIERRETASERGKAAAQARYAAVAEAKDIIAAKQREEEHERMEKARAEAKATAVSYEEYQRMKKAGTIPK